MTATVPISYEMRPVPAALQPFIRRIMLARHSADTAVTVPARPTGYCYIGWVPAGQASARANAAQFTITPQEYHLSGQLTTFDAEYTLHGPSCHFLAECTATGAFQLAKQDLGALRNQIATFPFAQDGAEPEAAFVNHLLHLAGRAGTVDSVVAKAAQQIEAANGNVSIRALAAECGLSERQLHRQFSKVVGLPPKAFAMIQRVLFALQRLTGDNPPDIADVAIEAGFTDQAHLTKYFGQFMRTTPAQLELTDDGVLRTIVAQV
ncbi:helix-turn-helix domain-containing protein [Yoonia sp. GPGPB17]|uniref:helix-turn-helix domain-containing protein n=1 Tax=Yoonia sp. GPGPB17 TaxID=3026147 RepID=UPI0030C5B306